MKHRIFSTALLLVMIFGVLAPSISSAATFEYSGWIAYWKKIDGAAQVSAHINQLSSITPFAYSVRSDGTLADTLKVGQDPWPALFALARSQNKKIIPSVMWSNTDLIYSTLATPSSRTRHEKAIVSMVVSNNFDGVEIDYENKKVATKIYFSKFLTELAALLHKNKKTLVCTIESRTPVVSRVVTPKPSDNQYVNDYAVIAKVCDEVRIMAYDQANIDIKLNAVKTSTTTPYMPVADTEWVEKVIKETLKTIPASKIVLGIPTYGREYEITPKNGKFIYKQISSISFKDAMAKATSYNIIPQRNNAGELSFQYTNGTSTRFISFTDNIAINSKIGLAKQYKLKGAALFKFDADSDLALWDTLK